MTENVRNNPSKRFSITRYESCYTAYLDKTPILTFIPGKIPQKFRGKVAEICLSLGADLVLEETLGAGISLRKLEGYCYAGYIGTTPILVFMAGVIEAKHAGKLSEIVFSSGARLERAEIENVSYDLTNVVIPEEEEKKSNDPQPDIPFPEEEVEEEVEDEDEDEEEEEDEDEDEDQGDEEIESDYDETPSHL